MTLCFVIGPIGVEGSIDRKHADLLLHAVIKEVLESSDFGYSVKRADEDADPGMIGDRVVSDIINSELVVADLTDLNPNVLYELGIRHSTEKPTIHMAKNGTTLPFDNVTHRTIFVDLGDWQSIQIARERLAASVLATRDPKYRVSNPITQANASFKMRQSNDPKDVALADVQDRLNSLESLVRPLTELSSNRKFAEDLSMSIANNLKINAIKLYRSQTSSGISEAKVFVEAIQRGDKAEAVRIHQSVTGAPVDEAIRFVAMLR